MNTATQTIPDGYKLTEAGIIPNDWKVARVGDLTSDVIDNRGKTPPYNENESVELVETASISFVNRSPDYSKVTKFVSNEVYKNWFRGHPQKGDILVSTVGEYSGSSAQMTEPRGTVAQNLIAMRFRKVNPDYVFYWTRSDSFKRQLKQVMMNQAQPSLKVPWLLDFKCGYPLNETEQSNIVAILGDIDLHLINLTKLIAKKKAIKQGAMQELLTGKRRLPGFSGEWEAKKLGQIGKPYGGIMGKNKKDFDGGNCFYIPFMNIMSNPIIDPTYLDRVNILPGETQNIALKGDLFFNGSSETPEEVGMCSVLLTDIPNLYLNSFCFGFRPYAELKTNGLFFSYYFRSEYGRELIFSLAQGATRYNLSKTNFLKLEIPFPKPEEQTAIASIILTIDSEIEKLEQKLEKYNQIKQGAMQVLLTGKIRLIKN